MHSVYRATASSQRFCYGKRRNTLALNKNIPWILSTFKICTKDRLHVLSRKRFFFNYKNFHMADSMACARMIKVNEKTQTNKSTQKRKQHFVFVTYGNI